MRYDILCGCGWGQLGMLEQDIPGCCPVCGWDLIPYADPHDYFEDDEDEEFYP